MLSPNQSLSEEGKRLTFYELFECEKWNIEIPIIQRDYAQGRSDVNTKEIRSTFIQVLYEHLCSGLNVNLDFVYGSLKQGDTNIFVPLDGQQRLTTLFLLHWYLAQQDDQKDSFRRVFVNGDRSAFTYETRTSSREFCDALVLSELSPGHLVTGSVADTLRDAPWFFLSWEHNPTIQSMLTMLDEIHKQFSHTTGLYRKLLQTEDPIITFQFLNLDAFKLTDELYIKMNARGKQLTAFENFKAKLELFIKGLAFPPGKTYLLEFEHSSRMVAPHEYFSFKVDTDWANLFWRYKNEVTKNFDDELMNFFRVIASGYLASKADSSGRLKMLLGDEGLTFNIYQDTGFLTAQFVLELIDTLDLLKNGNEKIRKYFRRYSIIDEDELFAKVVANDLSYAERIQFYAWYKYLLLNGDDHGLDDWMRVIFNLSQNTLYNEVGDFATAILAVEKLLPFSAGILTYLVKDRQMLSGFASFQLQEEHLKACLLRHGEKWSDFIFFLEEHGYFQGQISFLLSFSGIEKFFAEHGHCDWDKEMDKLFFDDLCFYSERAIAVFDSRGLITFPDFLFERALLSKGDYTLSTESNKSFLGNSGRDTSWKRLLRDDNGERRGFLKALFDDANFTTPDITTSLCQIIAAAAIDDWRMHFINLPETIAYLGPQKYFRMNSPDDIHLLEKKRLSGTHAEYYSYAFYHIYFLDSAETFAPFANPDYYYISGDNTAYTYITNEEYNCDIAVVWNVDPTPHFEIELLKLDEVPFDETLSKLAISLGLSRNEEGALTASVTSMADALAFILKICSGFKSLNDLAESVPESEDRLQRA